MRTLCVICAILTVAACGSRAQQASPQTQARRLHAKASSPDSAPVPVAPPIPSIEERFASLVPEFAGAYTNGGSTLVVRVTDLQLSRTGGEAAARALLQQELSASGRGELRVSFEGARYDYRRLETWLYASVDSLGAYHAVSWGIDQRTSRIHAGFPDARSERGFIAAFAKLGFPGDALATSLDSAVRILQNPELLSFRLVHDSVRAVRAPSGVEVTVQFAVRNQSDKTVYRTNDCGRSPMYWVERREVAASGKATWRGVFYAVCTGGDIPRPLRPSDSSLFTSSMFTFQGQTPEFAFSNHDDMYRFVYVVSTSGPVGPDVRIISPSVVVRAPE